jgi:hypothetical protein
MERTQKLLSIALAVLALDGCRGAAQHAEGPQPTGSPGSSSHTTSHYHSGAAAGAFIGGAMGGSANRRYPNAVNRNGTIDRTLGGNRGNSANGEGRNGGLRGAFHGGGFGHAGGFGGGG